MRNMCDERELATLVRSLGYNPTQVRTNEFLSSLLSVSRSALTAPSVLSQAHLRELLVDIRGDEQPTGEFD